MKKKMIFVLITLLIFGIIVPSVYCQETEKPSYKGSGKGEAILFDLFFLRPLGSYKLRNWLCCYDCWRTIYCWKGQCT